MIGAQKEHIHTIAYTNEKELQRFKSDEGIWKNLRNEIISIE